MKFHRQPDRNTKEIAAALREAGAVVEYLENSRKGGVPDLMVGVAGITYLIEVKAPDAKLRAREKGGRTLLSESQEEWADKWYGGPLVVVQSIEAAMAAVGLTQPHLDV